MLLGTSLSRSLAFKLTRCRTAQQQHAVSRTGKLFCTSGISKSQSCGLRMPSANARWYKVGDALLVLSQGDITQWSGDAIVNAANECMLGGGGVDGAIHRAAGPKLKAACEQVPEVAPGVRCPTGDARITIAGRLQTKYIIHTVGPVYKSAEESAPLLRKAYASCLELANKRKLENLAFPAVSTGVYGYPPQEAAEVALTAVKDSIGAVSYVEFVLHPAPMFETFVGVADRVLEQIQPAGGAQLSEPIQQEPTAAVDSQGRRHSASLHPSSQAAQPTESGSQSDSVCGGGAAAHAEREVTSAAAAAAAARGPTPSGTAPSGTAPSAGTAPVAAPSGAAAPTSTISGGPLGSVVHNQPRS